MPANVKPYKCILCGTKTPSDFYRGKKSLCTSCRSKPKTESGAKLTSSEIHKLVTRGYECWYCKDTNEDNFYKYCKGRCKKHYNVIKPEKLRGLSREELKQVEESDNEDIGDSDSSLELEENKIETPRRKIKIIKISKK